MSPGPYGRLAGRQQLRPTSQSNGGLSVPVAATFPPFNPLERITWAAAFWASDPLWANPGDGGKVSSWRDGSGNGRDITQGTDARRPTYRANHPQLNNQAAVEFVKADINRLVSATFTVSQPNSWVTISRFTDAVNNNEFMRIVDNNGVGGGRQLFGGFNSTQWVGLAGSVVTFNRAPDNAPTIGVFYVNGATSWIEINRVRSGNLSPGNSGVGSIGIGSDGGSSHLSAAVAFVGLYSGDLTTDVQWPTFLTWATNTYVIKG